MIYNFLTIEIKYLIYFTIDTKVVINNYNKDSKNV